MYLLVIETIYEVLHSGYARETTYKCKPQTHGHDRVKLIQKTSPSFLFARQLITSNDKFLDHSLYEGATSKLEKRRLTSQVSFSSSVLFRYFTVATCIFYFFFDYQFFSSRKIVFLYFLPHISTSLYLLKDGERVEMENFRDVLERYTSIPC